MRCVGGSVVSRQFYVVLVRSGGILERNVSIFVDGLFVLTRMHGWEVS